MNINNQIKELEKRIAILEQKRIYQRDIAPDEIKQLHIGEGVRYIRDGSSTDIPDEGEEPLQGAAIIFDYTNNKIWVWNRSTGAWKSVTLS